MGAVKIEVEGWRELKSRVGSGSVFCDAKAATCSILMSKMTMNMRIGQLKGLFPDLSQTELMLQVPMQHRTLVLILVVEN